MKRCANIMAALSLLLSLTALGQTSSGGSTEFQSLSGGSISSTATRENFPRNPVAAYSTIGPQCAYPLTPLPAGWIVTSATNVTQCSYPAVPGYYTINFGGHYYNQYTITSFYDIPVGGTLEYCSGMGVPTGWQVVNIIAQGRCDQMSDYVAQHTACIAGRDTNCYPPPPPVSGSLKASQTIVQIPFGQLGTTTLTYSTANLVGSACINVSMDGAAETSMYCGGSSGTSSPNWIQAGHSYVFRLYQQSGNVTLASVTVTGVSDGTPTIKASPNPVAIPAGQTSAAITVTWNAPGYSSVSWYGSNSLPPYNGQILCLGSGLPASYTYNGHMSTGEVAKLYIVPDDHCTAGTAVGSVPGPVLATTTVTTQ